MPGTLYYFDMRRHGFSLIELSIVLVILGLLVGGILAGQALIRAAELRSITTQHGRFITSVHTFRDKYFALPGDMSNAQSVWGVATNCPGTASQGSTTIATCNGNADRQIDPHAGSNESFRFWQHLANAGLIEGTYSGVTGDDGYSLTAVPGNTPGGRLGSSLWHVWYADNSAVATYASYMWRINLGNHLMFGKARSAAIPRTPLITPPEAWNIDSKMDDGRPGRGKVVSNAVPSASNGYCTDAADAFDIDADYQLDRTDAQCILVFPLAF